MPNTLTNLKDIKVAQNALRPWTATLAPLRAFSRNFSPAPAEKLDTVRVPVVGAPSQSSDFAGSYVENVDSTITSVPVTLNRHKFKTVHVTAREASETALNVLNELVATAVQQLAEDVLVDIFSIITAANYGAPALGPLAANDFGYTDLLTLRSACNAVKMPMSNRSVIIDDSYFTNLLADDVVKASPVERVAEAGIVEAVIRRLAGFDVFSSLVIPENGEDLIGFATHPNGLAVAMRYLVPVARYDEAGAVTHPETGLTFGYLRYTDTNSNRIFVTVECLYGFNAAIGAGIKRITKPAA
jgi:hypothetical protein